MTCLVEAGALTAVSQRTDGGPQERDALGMVDSSALSSEQELILRRVAEGWVLPPRLLRRADFWLDVELLVGVGLIATSNGEKRLTALGVACLANVEKKAHPEDFVAL